MKYLLKLCILCCLCFHAFTELHAQRKLQAFASSESYANSLNVFLGFGDNSAIRANYELPLAKNFTISPEAYLPLNFEFIYAGARVDYYFDELVNLAADWDIWGGLRAGLYLGSDVSNEIRLNLQLGGEYRLNETWGILLEIGGGKMSNAGIGAAIHL